MTAYDQWKTDAPEPVEIDSVAYEALKAHPVMVEEAMTNQDGAFWAIIAMSMNGGYDTFVVEAMGKAVDSYVKDKVEDYASDEEISVNEAIHRLLNMCNGGK